MTAPELREELEKRGLSSDGKKNDLMMRLAEAINNDKQAKSNLVRLKLDLKRIQDRHEDDVEHLFELDKKSIEREIRIRGLKTNKKGHDQLLEMLIRSAEESKTLAAEPIQDRIAEIELDAQEKEL